MTHLPVPALAKLLMYASLTSTGVMVLSAVLVPVKVSKRPAVPL